MEVTQADIMKLLQGAGQLLLLNRDKLLKYDIPENTIKEYKKSFKTVNNVLKETGHYMSFLEED